MTDERPDPDDCSVSERTIARLERRLAVLLTACAPLLAVARDIRNDGKRGDFAIPVPLSVCRSILAAVPLE